MKIFRFVTDNILFILTLFLLTFIPLYPKLPLLDVRNTWVYIRAEDFFVVFVLLVWLLLLIRKKITLRTPLTFPIILFWIIGAIATIHGVLLIFPVIAGSGVHTNVAFLSFLRRIEYVSLFFVAYSGIKDKRSIPYVVAVMTGTLILIIAYGFGQKFYGFPAYLTMNEEFAKGIPIRLSELSRVPSTFAGHYDLAAYLVLVIPILTSMIFGFKNWFVKLPLLVTISFGFVLLFMTVSRVSFFVLLISMILVFLFQKKRLIILFLFMIAFVFLSFSSSLLQRFGDTVKEVDVLVDAQTGEAIGHVKDIEASYFKDKIIKRKFAQTKDEIIRPIEDEKQATSSAKVLFTQLPPKVALVVESNAPTGENLPQGTSYINLPLSPVTKKLGQFFYQKSKDDKTAESSEIFSIHGDFLVKKAVAYDLSFTTRFQGEWPQAIDAFKRNILFGSGYSSVGLAVDNNYLRILGEVGLLGFSSFLAIFLFAGIYIKKVLPEVDSLVVKSFILGMAAGVVGLALNAVFIDVFEASKIAFFLWLLLGVTIGVLHLYQKSDLDFYRECKKVTTSSSAIAIYLFIITVVVFLPISNYFFVGDDFTWFRWIADCNIGNSNVQECPSITTRIISYFTDANGFFYRPGTKVYFLLMYSGFWLNQTLYHMVSVFLHFIVAMLLFLIAKKVLRDSFISALSAFLFLILSGYFEAVFWISSTGFLFNAVFALLSLLFFILWKEKNKIVYFIFCLFSIIFSLLFHELGVITPLFIILYEYVTEEKFIFRIAFRGVYYLILFFPILPYLALRFFAQSHWFSGDYSYNLLKLPYNIVGNAIGYIMLAFFGPASFPIYQSLRSFSREHIVFSGVVSLIMLYLAVKAYRIIIWKMTKDEQKIVIFGSLFFLIALLPFLGLGNITSRYSYLSSIGFVILFSFFLKKLYFYLRSNGQYIALLSVIMIGSIFFLIHVIQLQKIHEDWHGAGEKAKRFFISMDRVYINEWTKEHLQFYFVNVPIRYADAWVFPVGLNDALWFVFRNQYIRVYQIDSVNQAITAIEDPKTQKVFEFDDSGKVVERRIATFQ